MLTRMPSLALAGVVGVIAATCGGGCSSFHQDSRAALSHPPAPSSIEGRWEGRWSEGSNPNHGGRLQCVLTRTGDTLYRASSRSQWRRVFSAEYDTLLVATPVEPGAYLLRGGRDIWPLGAYSVTGRVDSTQFVATFSVAGHPGVMEMHRTGVAPVAAK